MNSQNARPCPTSMCTALPPQKATDLQQGPNLHINPQNSVIILSFLLICCRAIQMPFSFFLTRWLIMLNVRPLQLPDESIWEQRLLLTDKPTILEEFLKNVPQITTGKPKDVNMGLGNTRILTDYVQSSPGHSSGAAFILRVSSTSHTRLRARDRCTSSTLNGTKRKVEPGQVRLRDHVSKWMQDGCRSYMDSYVASNGKCFTVTRSILKNHLLEVGLINTNPEDHYPLLIHYIISCVWIRVNRNASK